jgi:hypothetical protein
MATFLLYWNPFFSSYKMDRFLRDFNFPVGLDVLTEDEDWDRSPDFFNWSIIEHEKAKRGDRFFFVKVGYEKPTGIIGTGTFTSDPYVDEDWSGQGRKIYYMNMEWDAVINPKSDKILPTETLATEIPEVVWSKGKAGVMVSNEVAEKLQCLWDEHLKKVKIKVLVD